MTLLLLLPSKYTWWWIGSGGNVLITKHTPTTNGQWMVAREKEKIVPLDYKIDLEFIQSETPTKRPPKRNPSDGERSLNQRTVVGFLAGWLGRQKQKK